MKCVERREEESAKSHTCKQLQADIVIAIARGTLSGLGEGGREGGGRGGRNKD